MDDAGAAHGLGKIGINIGILKRKRHASAKTPSSVQDIDAPKSSDGCRLLIGVGEEGRIGFATMQAELETVAGSQTNNTPCHGFVVAGEVIHCGEGQQIDAVQADGVGQGLVYNGVDIVK